MTATQTSTVRILIADDHPVVRIGLRNMLAADPEFQVVGEAADGVEALDRTRELLPNVLLLDVAMPRMPGFEVLREIVSHHPQVRPILLTATIAPRQVAEALQLGARGIVLKDALGEDLGRAIRCVVQGRYWLGGREVSNLVDALRDLVREEETSQPVRKTFGLTARELQVVGCIVEGCTNRDIAETFKISEDTVKRHLTNIFNKTGVSSRLELALFAMNHHLLRPE